MITFGDYLCNIMQRYNLTISSVASKAKIDRTLLSKAISGSRSLNRTTFKKLISALEPTHYETETLTELYAASYFSESNYARIQLLKKHLEKGTSISTAGKVGLYSSDSNEFKNNDDIIFSDNIYSVKEKINILLNDEWCNKKPVIYTNYSFNNEFITEQIIECITKYNNPDADFRHIVCFSSETKQNDELQFVMNAMRFQQNGFTTKYYIAGDCKNHYFDVLYPYYIITTDKTILFDGSLDKAILVSNSIFTDSYKAKFREIDAKCNNIISSLKDSKNLRDMFLPYCSNSHEMITMTKNLSLFINDETVHLLDFGTDDITAIRYVNELCDINSHILSDFSFYTVILYKKVITDFIKNGTVHGIPTDINISVKKENRYEFLMKLFDFMSRKNVSFCITNDTISQISDDILIMLFRSETYKNNIVFTNTLSNDANIENIKLSCVTTTDDAVVKTYSDFIEYLILFSYTENTQASLDYLQKQLEYTNRLYSA